MIEIARIVSIDVDLQYSFAPYGKVTGAEVEIEAPLFTMMARPNHHDAWLLHLTHNDLGTCTVAALYLPDYPGEIHSQIAASQTFYCVALHRVGVIQPQGSGTSGLVLTRMEDGGYQRIGRFRAYIHIYWTEQRLGDDGCMCQDRSVEARHIRDKVVADTLAQMPRQTVRIR